MQFSTTFELKRYLFNIAINNEIMYDIKQIEKMANPMINNIGLDDTIREKFEKYLLMEDDYGIDASDALKSLEIIAIDVRSDKIQRCLIRANIIPDNLKLNTMEILYSPSWGNINKSTTEGINEEILYAPSWGHINKSITDDTDKERHKYGVIYTNEHCKIIKCKGNLKKPVYKYMITKCAFQKVLYRAYNNDKFADYFALIMELYTISKNYQSMYTQKQLEKEKKQLQNDNEAKELENISLRELLKKQHAESIKILNRTEQAATNAELAANIAKYETVKTNKKLDIVVDAMDLMHEDFTETAYHSTAIVPECKQTYFALTGIINDENIQFRAWRTQNERIFKVLTKVMTEQNHQLIIPPMYVAGSINIPIAAMSKIKLQLRDIAIEHNKTNKGRQNRWSMTKLIKDSGLTLHCIDPIWVPNKFITRDDMVGAYLDIINDSKNRSFQNLEIPIEFKDIIMTRKLEYNNRINNATGKNKEYLEAMAQTIDNVYTLLK